MGSLDKGDTSMINVNSIGPKVGDTRIIVKPKIYLEFPAAAPAPNTTPRTNMLPRNIMESTTE
jgi:hypothetical protein